MSHVRIIGSRAEMPTTSTTSRRLKLHPKQTESGQAQNQSKLIDPGLVGYCCTAFFTSSFHYNGSVVLHDYCCKIVMIFHAPPPHKKARVKTQTKQAIASHSLAPPAVPTLPPTLSSRSLSADSSPHEHLRSPPDGGGGPGRCC